MKPRLLLVDDDPLIAESLAQLDGFCIYGFAQGTEPESVTHTLHQLGREYEGFR